MMLYVLITVFVIVCCYLIWQKIELSKFATTLYKIPLSKNNNVECCGKPAVRFVVIADLHNHVYGKDNEKLIKAIDKCQPDFIVIAGDMMIAKPGYSLNIVCDFLKKISGRYTVYYGMGNHEYRLKLYKDKYPGMYDEFIRFIKEQGIILLENKSETIEVNGQRIVITGLEIEKEYYKRIKKIHMETDYINSLVGRKTDEFTILIAHNPEYFDTYIDWGADLIVSGHIHGGMVILPFLGGVISPKVQFFPKYDSGMFKKNGGCMILSRGLGMHTIPVRINNRAELVEVHLLKEG